MSEQNRLYITEYYRDGFRYEGPQIAAGSWAEAEAIAGRLRVILVGELQSVTDADTEHPLLPRRP